MLCVFNSRFIAISGSGQGLLQSEGDLLDSIQYLVDREKVEIDSNLVYAATHQYGDKARGISARTYLELSDEDERELEELCPRPSKVMNDVRRNPALLSRSFKRDIFVVRCV